MIANKCMCGSSLENARAYCYFATDTSLDRFDFGGLIYTLKSCSDPENKEEINLQKLNEDLIKSLNFFGSLDVESYNLERCQEFLNIATICRGWMDNSRDSPKLRSINFLAFYNYFLHFSHAFQRRINRLTHPNDGAPLALILTSEYSCASSELIDN